MMSKVLTPCKKSLIRSSEMRAVRDELTKVDTGVLGQLTLR